MMRRLRRHAPQLLRRGLQLGVLAFIAYAAIGGIWRNFKVAHNSARLVALMEGDAMGQLYTFNESALALWDEDTHAASLDFVGMPWASTLFGLEGADPILVAAHVVRTRTVEPGLWVGLLVPLAVVLLFGKVFCSHLCPMRPLFEFGQLLRGGLLRLGLPLPHLRGSDRFGGWILAGGLLATALVGTSIWYFLLPYISLGAGLFLLITTSTLSGILWVAIGWFLVDMLIAPGYWCHNLCPQGFLLEQLGRAAPLQVRHVPESAPCPAGCHVCETTCPYALSPRELTHRPACDACGLCVVACPRDKLVRGFSLRPLAGVVAAGLMGLLALEAPPAAAHHNKGLPHYGYFENYPQVPTQEDVVVHGDWEMGATIFNFQGYELRESSDTPNDVKFYVYLYDLAADVGYVGPARFEIRLEGSDELVSTFTRYGVDEEQVYSTRETLPRTGDYTLTAFVTGRDGGAEVSLSLPFYVDLNEEGIDWALLGVILLPLLPLFLLALLGRTRRARAKRRRAQGAAISGAGALLLAALPRRALAQVSRPKGNLLDCDVPGAELAPHYLTEGGDVVMVMGGLPPWLFVAGVALVLLLSFVAVERLGTRPVGAWRKNLIKDRRLFRLVRSRWFQVIPQLLMIGVFAFLIYSGLAGSRLRNVTPVAVWTVWWAGLIFAIVMLGPIWCFVCPWDGLANLVSRMGLSKRTEPLSLELSVPPWLRNVYPAVLLFTLLSWAELGLGITTDPRWTAYLGLGMAAAAVAGALLFQDKAFCRYACPVGRINGIYANFAPVEVRVRKPGACKTCVTEDCLNGNDQGYPCPTGISLKTTSDATYCTMCTECVKSCPRQNVAFNIRPFAADLDRLPAARLDEAWLCLSLLALTLFHGFSMTTVWEDFAPGSWSLLKWLALSLDISHMAAFTLAMGVAVGVPLGLYVLAARLSSWLTRGSAVSSRELFIRYAYALLPVALFYHLAHNAMHLLSEGGEVVPLLSDPLGRGADYLGTATLHIGPLMPEQAIWMIQVALIVVGHLFGIVVAHRMSRRLFSDPRLATRSLVPMLALTILISVAGLTLMVLDMNMRAGRM